MRNDEPGEEPIDQEVTKRTRSKQWLCVRTGIFSALGLTLYFLVMKWFGLHEYLELRVFNFIFLVSGLWFVLRTIKGEKEGIDHYFSGLGYGLLTTVVAAGLFANFILIYLNIDREFMQYITENAPMGRYLSPFSAAVVILIEGLTSGFVVTFALMQYFKKPRKSSRQ